MVKKYLSKDSRTGYAEGEVITLSDEELIHVPFNVYLEFLEVVDEDVPVKVKSKKKESK